MFLTQESNFFDQGHTQGMEIQILSQVNPNQSHLAYCLDCFQFGVEYSYTAGR